jgi:hypothetical protein
MRYFLALFALPIVLYVCPFAAVRMPSYGRWSRTIDFPNLEFAFNTSGQNADVVIYGDSTAKIGIDPSQMSAALNLKVLDLPRSYSTLLVDDDLPLRRYVKANKPPRLIVFYFAPWNFDYGNDNSDRKPLYNGMEMLVRHGTADEIWAFAKANPLYMMQFPLMFYSVNANLTAFDREAVNKQIRQVITTNGHMDIDLYNVMHCGPTCVIPQGLIGRMRFEWVRKMSEKYRTEQTKVMYFAAPIPACVNAQAVIDHASGVLPAAPPKALPASLFVDDTYYCHLYAAGVPQATQNLINAVRPLLAN